MDPKDVGEWQHEEFYRYIAQAHDKPRYTLHYKADAPLNIRSIFYVPEMVSTGLGGRSLSWGRPPPRPCPISRGTFPDGDNGDSSAQTSQN